MADRKLPPPVDPTAASLCATWARYAPAIAATAAGEGLTRSTLAGAFALIDGALEVIDRAPLTDYWRGYAGALADAARGMLDAADACHGGNAAPALEAGAVQPLAPLDVAAAAGGTAAAVAVGALYEAGAVGLQGPLTHDAAGSSSPAVVAVLDVLQARADAGDDAAAGLADYLAALRLAGR